MFSLFAKAVASLRLIAGWGRDAHIDRFVGKKLSAFRAKRAISIHYLSTDLGIPCSVLKKYEAGRQQISAAQLFVIAKYFEVPVAAFFDPRSNAV